MTEYVVTVVEEIVREYIVTADDAESATEVGMGKAQRRERPNASAGDFRVAKVVEFPPWPRRRK